MNIIIFAGHQSQARELIKAMYMSPSVGVITRMQDMDKMHGILTPICFLTGTWYLQFELKFLQMAVSMRRGTLWNEAGSIR